RFFGLHYSVPEMLEVLPVSEQLIASGLVDNKNSFALLLARSALEPAELLPRESVRILATRAEALWGDQWRTKTAADYLGTLSKRKPDEIAGPLRRSIIDGDVFYILDTRSKRPNAYQSNLSTISKGFVVSIIFEGRTHEDLNQVESSIEKL